MCVCMCVCAVCSVRCVVQCRVDVKSCGGYLSPPLYTLYTLSLSLSLSLSTHPLSHSLDTHNNPRRNPRHTNTTDRPYDTHLSASLIPRTSLTHVDTQPLQRHNRHTNAQQLSTSHPQSTAPRTFVGKPGHPLHEPAHLLHVLVREEGAVQEGHPFTLARCTE